MKFTRTKEKQFAEFLAVMDLDGCVGSSDWVRGSRRDTRRKITPPFVVRFDRDDIEYKKPTKLKGLEVIAYEYFQKNKRRQSVLVLDKEAAMTFFFDAANCKEY